MQKGQKDKEKEKERQGRNVKVKTVGNSYGASRIGEIGVNEVESSGAEALGEFGVGPSDGFGATAVQALQADDSFEHRARRHETLGVAVLLLLGWLAFLSINQTRSLVYTFVLYQYRCSAAINRLSTMLVRAQTDIFFSSRKQYKSV